jgi:glycerol-3-phosphate dehydrogenase
MRRDEMIQMLQSEPWNVIIIGGGATGLGAAVESSTRGYRTLLLEQSDFAKGTSSRSTKLIHGGVRYLQQGNIALVVEALRERGLLCQNAPHLIDHRSFLVPNYAWWEGPFYGIGLKIYDMLAGKLGIETSTHLSREETLKAIPTLEPKGLRGGVMYYDGQFDDARLAMTLAHTAADHGACLINYMKVTKLLKRNGLVEGVVAVDQESGKKYHLHGHVVINATGPFSDQIRKMDNLKSKPIIAPSQGIHLTLNRSFLPSEHAILIPRTEDKRVIFMVPWHGVILLGTTDTPVKKTTLEPKALKKEIRFLLDNAAKYLVRAPTTKDVLSVFAGLRPLVKAKSGKNTAALSRDHSVLVSASGLITIAGGKWTTYRKMGEDVINKAAAVGGLVERASQTHALPLHGWQENVDPLKHWSPYGTDAKKIKKMIREQPSLGKLLHPELPYVAAELVWAVRYEMARTVEDLLARRTRALLLNARASIEIAPRVAKLLAKELKKDAKWERKQIVTFKRLAKNYQCPL